MRIKPIWIASAALVLALPALAQQVGTPAPATPQPATQPAATTNPSAEVPSEGGTDESAVEEVSSTNLEQPVPALEYPGCARRDPWTVGADGCTPKLAHVAVQGTLANGAPPALCRLKDGIKKYDPGIPRPVQAMCASLAGEPEAAAAMIAQARRFGRIGGVDLALAEKV